LEVLVKRLSQQLQAEARNGSPRSPFEAGSRQSVPPALSPAMPPMTPPAFAAAPERLEQARLEQARLEPPRATSGQTPSWTDALKASVNQTVQTNAPPLEFGALEATEFDLNFDSNFDSNFDGSSLDEPDESEQAVEADERQRPGRRRLSLQQGLGFVLLSTVVMSLHYVGVGILGNASQVFGQQAVGGYLSLTGFSNAALLLWIRMLVVVPVMLWLATRIHPSTLRDLRAFTRSGDRRGLWGVLGSGIFLFLSQVLLYLAIGQIGPGAAIATLFVYPVGLLLLNGLLFAEKLSLNRIGMMLVILVGVGLTVYAPLAAQSAGVVAALLAALAFVFYLTSMQITARKLHPVPVSLMQFASMFVLSSLSLIVMGIKGSVNWSGLLVGGAILGLLTVGSYLLNHFGIRAIGAARSSIIASSTPALTALLAFFLVPGALTTLNVMQIVGILTVTLGGTALGLERMLLQNQAVRQAKLREQELAATE
jgi:drug/metabolite transporter (DMT)-like permease